MENYATEETHFKKQRAIQEQPTKEDFAAKEGTERKATCVRKRTMASTPVAREESFSL